MGAYAWLAIAFFWVYALQFAVYHGIRSWQRLRVSEKRALEWMALARERELATLRAQVQPHFLFNTLNSISATVGRDPAASRAMIARLADLLRYALESGAQPDVPLGRELDVARDYLTLEGHRMRDRLGVDFQIDDRALGARLPPMTLQPLVENAVKHGLAPSVEGGTVRVIVEVEDEHVVVTIEDDGAGAGSGDGSLPDALSSAQVASTGVGLDNTSRRLIHLHGPTAALESGPITPQGWRVRFRLPLGDIPLPDSIATTAHA
jgi:LytS/YehU family sensor histidine kinase